MTGQRSKNFHAWFRLIESCVIYNFPPDIQLSQKHQIALNWSSIVLFSRARNSHQISKFTIISNNTRTQLLQSLRSHKMTMDWLELGNICTPGTWFVIIIGIKSFTICCGRIFFHSFVFTNYWTKTHLFFFLTDLFICTITKNANSTWIQFKLCDSRSFLSLSCINWLYSCSKASAHVWSNKIHAKLPRTHNQCLISPNRIEEELLFIFVVIKMAGKKIHQNERS